MSSVKLGEWWPSHRWTYLTLSPRSEGDRRAGVREEVETGPGRTDLLGPLGEGHGARAPWGVTAREP